MAARSIASVTVSFGLVAIPVKVYTAHQTGNDLRFNLLHATCGSRLRQQYVCLKEDVVVPREEMAKGYEVAKDQFVLFENEELKALEEPPTQTVEIAEFLPLAAIDPVYFERTYYLAPDKGGGKPYALLTRALDESARCAVGRWAARGKQYIVLLRPVDGVLTLQQLHYANEVRAPTEIEVPQVAVGEAELKLARQLIDAQTSEAFEPTAYTDDVRARVEAAIQQKVEGKQVQIAEARPEPTGKVVDLMEALRRSLDQQQRGRPTATEEVPAERKPAKRAERPARGRGGSGSSGSGADSGGSGASGGQGGADRAAASSDGGAPARKPARKAGRK